MNKNLLIAALLIIIFGGGAILAYQNFLQEKGTKETPKATITNFEQCVAAGNPVQESYPRGCSADGKSFTEDIGNALEKSDLIVLEKPFPNDKVTSPLQIKGEARGSWFFEASFPIKILDSNGKVLGTATATTSENWMSENFVSFTATLTFTTPTTEEGTLVLEKDNPSGLAENDDSLMVPVKF